MFFLILLGAATLAGIIYLAISRKSSMLIRIVALCALALMVITVIISLFYVFGLLGSKGSGPQVLPDMELSEAPQTAPPNFMALILFIVFLVVFFILVLVLSLREKKKVLEDKNAW